MPSSQSIKRIKEVLEEICEHSLALMPPNELHMHPCDWLQNKMDPAIAAIEEVRNKVIEEVNIRKERIEKMQTEKKKMLFALKDENNQNSSEEISLWICEKNLYLKEAMLSQELAEISEKYKEQQSAFLEIAEEIKTAQRDLEEYVENEGECKEVLREQVVTKTLISNARALLTRLKRRKEEIKAKTKEKIQKANALMLQIGISADNFVAENIDDLKNLLTMLETETEKIQRSLESYNYTVSTINTAESSKPKEPALKTGISVVHLKSSKEIKHSNNLLDQLSVTRGDKHSFSILADISYAQAKDIETKLSALIKTAEEIDSLLSQRIIFLASRIEVSGQEDLSDTTVMRRILIQMAWIQQIEEEYKQRIEELFREQKKRLKLATAQLESITGVGLPKVCISEVIEDLKFTEQENILLDLEKHTIAAETEYEILKNIHAFTQERKELLLKMSAFEEQASDPRRLFRSSFQLNSEEKFRKMAVPTLLRVEKEIFTLADRYSEEFEKPVRINQKEIIEELKNEISSRIINTNTFMTARQKPTVK